MTQCRRVIGMCGVWRVLKVITERTAEFKKFAEKRVVVILQTCVPLVDGQATLEGDPSTQKIWKFVLLDCIIKLTKNWVRLFS